MPGREQLEIVVWREAAVSSSLFSTTDDEWLPPISPKVCTPLDKHGQIAAAVVSGYFEHLPAFHDDQMWRRRGLRDGEMRLSAVNATSARNCLGSLHDALHDRGAHRSLAQARRLLRA